MVHYYSFSEYMRIVCCVVLQYAHGFCLSLLQLLSGSLIRERRARPTQRITQCLTLTLSSSVLFLLLITGPVQ